MSNEVLVPPAVIEDLTTALLFAPQLLDLENII